MKKTKDDITNEFVSSIDNMVDNAIFDPESDSWVVPNVFFSEVAEGLEGIKQGELYVNIQESFPLDTQLIDVLSSDELKKIAEHVPWLAIDISARNQTLDGLADSSINTMEYAIGKKIVKLSNGRFKII
jgi:hypothetical protein